MRQESSGADETAPETTSGRYHLQYACLGMAHGPHKLDPIAIRRYAAPARGWLVPTRS